MAANSETLIIDADASGYVSEVGRAVASSRKLAGAEDDLARASKGAATASRSLSDRLGDLNKVNNATGGSFSAITGPLDDFGDLTERVGAKQAVMATGAGLVAAAFVKVAGAVYDVFANVENYRDSLNSLQDRGIISAADVQGLEMASAAMSTLATQMGGWATEIAVRIAPTVSKFLMGTAYALQYVESLVRTWSFERANKDAMAAARELYDAMQAVKDKTEETTKTNQTHTAAVRSNGSAQAVAAQAAEERTRRLEEEGNALGDLITLQAKAAAQSAADAAAIGAFHAQSQGAQDAQQGVQTGGGEMGGIGFRMQDFQWSEDPLIDQDQERADNGKRTASEWAQHWQGGINTAAEAFDQFSSLVLMAGSAIIKGTEKDTKAAKKKQFAIEKAAAITSATISTFQAVAANLTIPPVPVGIALAAIAGAAGAVQIGLIAAQQPKFHRGGLMPDEVDTSGARLRQNESVAVMTAQAMRAMGGQEGIARANAGQPVTSGDTYLVVDGAPRLARQFAGPDPHFGIAKRGMGYA